MNELALEVNELSKRYRIGAAPARYRTIRESLQQLAARTLTFARRRAEQPECWALRDVSFAVRPGEVVGIVGRNGAGKSTLLKVLSRITLPTSGGARVYGRVGSLLEVGTGFHNELTGRENVFLNGAILGMTRREIRRRFQEIVDFAEVGDLLDTPVKRYSSGMYARLAFAVAAHLDPEILIVDEVLSVGDAGFQRKCLATMRDVGSTGRTVLFVSHNMAAVEALCDRCILLHDGEIVADGPVADVLARYRRLTEAEGSVSSDLRHHPRRAGSSRPVMTEVRLSSQNGEPVSAVRMGEPLAVEVSFDNGAEAFCPVLWLVVRTGFGAPLFCISNTFIPGYEFSEPVSSGRIVCTVRDLPLMPGSYSIDLTLADPGGDLDVIHDVISFDVIPADVFGSGKLAPAMSGPLCWHGSFALSPGGRSPEWNAT